MRKRQTGESFFAQRHRLVLTFSLLLLPFLGRSDPPAHEAIEVEKILDASQAAPPELAADLRLQLVEKQLIKTKERRLQAVEEAFDLAGNASFKLPLIPARRGGTTDSDAGLLGDSLRLRLDALSLELRAVQQFLRFDPKRARDAFEAIPGLSVPNLSCRDAMGYSLDAFYAVLGEVYSGSFSAEERKKGRDSEFLFAHLTQPRTAFELEPAAHLLNGLKLNAEQLSQAVTRLIQAFADVPNDDRAFTSASSYSQANEFFELAQKLEKNGLSSHNFVSAFGSYLQSHLHNDRCADNASAGKGASVMKEIAKDFNDRFRNLSADTKSVPAITPDDLQATSSSGKVEIYNYWEKPETRQLMAEYRQLRFGSPDEQSTDEHPTERNNLQPYLGRALRSRDEWLSNASDFLEKVDEWDASGEPGTAGFHEKLLMYEALLAVIPKGPLRRSVFTETLEFLRNSPVERDSPPEWVHHLERLLRTQYEESDQAEFTRVVADLGDATMQAYAGLLTLSSRAH